MREIRIMILAVGLLWFAGGCAGARRAEKVSLPGGSGVEPAATTRSTDLSGNAPRPCLEGYGFAIFGFRALRDSYERVSVVGEIKNTGSGTRGVELQTTLRDADGRIIAVGHFCPASNRNIDPDETWPFTYSFGIQSAAADAELRIVGSFHTTDILSTSTTAR